MQTDHRPRFLAAILGLTVIFLGVFAGLEEWVFQESAEQLFSEAQAAFAGGQYAEAEQLASRVAGDSPLSPAALLLAGRAAIKQRRATDAVGYFDRVPDDGSDAALEAHFLAGDMLLNGLYRLSEAEQRFRRVLAVNPQHVQANQHQAFLLGLCGRNWEAVPCRLELLRQGAFTPTDLLLLALRETARENTDVLAEYVRRNPNDPLARLGSAVAALRLRQWERAEVLLREVIASAPELTEAQVRLGSLLRETDRTVEFQEWNRRLPAPADERPETWALRGDFAHSQGKLRGAARCYWESLQRDPCYQRAAYQLGQVLLALDEPDKAAPFVDRAAMLQDLLLLMKRHTAAPDAATVHRTSQLCEKLGMLWEAWGWSRAALERDPQLTWAVHTVERLGPRLKPDLPRTSLDADPTRKVDLSDFPMPHWASTRQASPLSSTSSIDHSTRFADEASSTLLNFTFFNDADPRKPTARPFEFTGGGVAVLDYDGDGWPDVYLTQGCHWPPREGQVEYLDRLFRNLGNGQFEDVTDAAGLIEDRYSQGVTVGDYNGDGDPDLYIANLDANRLYRNNGDGTFNDVTAETDTGGDRWTTSCVLADLNGDAWPDIYAVNYLAGSDVFERICRNDRGEPRNCTPHDFDPAQDQLYLNLGDGRFEEWTDESGINMPHGKGLGIIAADLNGSGRLDLFVANDTDGNCCFVNETSSPGEPPLFRERAIGSGLAFDRDGLTQACMGVAAGDANADGLIDLFVTNYYDEANTLYLQQPGSLFRDASQEAGLREPSLRMLGFGTQFLDGELDGHPDLIVTNGHVGDYRNDGVPYRMCPQYFRNLGAGRFVELSADSSGSYFQRGFLGRGLARLDWNRDGREDVVVSHLDAPAALLTNGTSGAGHFLAIRLVAVASSRDAIGTTVRLTTDEQTWSRQLTAGDGYQASNQRQLVFGLGARERVDELIVQWPSGLSQRFYSPPIDVEFLTIEGREDLVRMPSEELFSLSP